MSDLERKKKEEQTILLEAARDRGLGLDDPVTLTGTITSLWDGLSDFVNMLFKSFSLRKDTDVTSINFGEWTPPPENFEKNPETGELVSRKDMDPRAPARNVYSVRDGQIREEYVKPKQPLTKTFAPKSTDASEVTKQELKAFADLAPVQQILDFIAQHESNGDYCAQYPNTRDPSVTQKTINELIATYTGAIGKYQCVKDTLIGVRDKFNIPGIDGNSLYDESTQEAIGAYLLLEKRNVKVLFDTDFDSEEALNAALDEAALEIAKEWAAMPMKNGESYYEGQNGNRASVDFATFKNALRTAKMLHDQSRSIVLNNWAKNYKMTSAFGERNGELHAGIDHAVPTGTKMHAQKSCTVAYAGHSDGYGNTIVLNMGHGVYTLYAHLDAINVSTGQLIKQNDLLGTTGNSGRSRGAHLHTEILLLENGKAYPVDPNKAWGLDLRQQTVRDNLIKDAEEKAKEHYGPSRAFDRRVLNNGFHYPLSSHDRTLNEFEESKRSLENDMRPPVRTLNAQSLEASRDNVGRTA